MRVLLPRKWQVAQSRAVSAAGARLATAAVLLPRMRAAAAVRVEVAACSRPASRAVASALPAVTFLRNN